MILLVPGMRMQTGLCPLVSVATCLAPLRCLPASPSLTPTPPLSQLTGTALLHAFPRCPLIPSNRPPPTSSSPPLLSQIWFSPFCSSRLSPLCITAGAPVFFFFSSFVCLFVLVLLLRLRFFFCVPVTVCVVSVCPYRLVSVEKSRRNVYS